MIIEFNGLPGCGKTAIKKALVDYTKNNKNVKAVGVSEYSSEKSIKLKRIFVKLIRFFALMFPSNFRFSLKCIKVYFKSASCNTFFPRSVYEDLVAVSYMVYLYIEYKKNKDKVLVVDEGLIQTISSVITVKSVKKKYIDDIINEFLALENSYFFINCDCDVNLSLQRICKRNRHDAAIDSLHGEILVEYLNKYNVCLNEVRQKLDNGRKYSLNLSSELPLEKQVEIIIEKENQIQ